MGNIRLGGKVLSLLLLAAVAWAGCSAKDVRDEAVATVDGDPVKVSELREFLGFRGGGVSAALVPVAKKKEALDRLVSGRLLARDARSRGLDNTEEFRAAIAQNDQVMWITALFRKEFASRVKVTESEIAAEAKKLRESDKNLSEEDARARGAQVVSEQMARKVEEELIAEARKDAPLTVDKELVQRIGKGENVGDNAVLATAGKEKITWSQVKVQLQQMSPGPHGGQDLSRNPVAIERVLDREAAGRALYAYAKKQGLENSEWLKGVKGDMERAILINLVADKVVPAGVSVTDKEIADAYAEHGQMFVRDGKKIPLKEVKEQIRAFLVNSKKRKSFEEYLDGLKKKGKVTVDEEVLKKA
jgi:hypothetical protein